MSIMHEKFLRGGEREDFDYKQCDQNMSLCAAEEDEDGEAAYFEDNGPSSMGHEDGDLL